MERFVELSHSAPKGAFRPLSRPEGGVGLAAAERAFLEARAQLERQQRTAAEGVNAQMLAANLAMAEASRLAAKASAEAARWAKWAALFTAFAAVVGLVAAVL